MNLQGRTRAAAILSTIHSGLTMGSPRLNDLDDKSGKQLVLVWKSNWWDKQHITWKEQQKKQWNSPWVFDLAVRKSAAYDVSYKVPPEIVLKYAPIAQHQMAQFLDKAVEFMSALRSSG